MDNFRQPRPRMRSRQTIDGFVGPRKPAAPALKQRLQTEPIANNMPAANQPVVDGFRRNITPQQLSPKPQVVPKPPIASRTLPRLDMSLPEGDSPEVRQPKHHRLSSIRKWSLRGAVTLVVLGLGVGGFLAYEGYLNLHKVFRGGASAAALQTNVDPTLLKGEGDGRVNILLLGNGGDGHEAPDLTDTMIIASIDPVNNTAALLSVPRDLWVNVPNYGSMKLNAVYETGKYKYLGGQDDSNTNTKAVEAGFSMIDQELENILGIPIHYNMLVNFHSFQKAVDTVGGVTVNVPEQLYDPTMAWENNWNPVLAKAGTQTMNGKQALLYVRSRETSSDFARSERQRSVILALKDKVLTLGILSNPIKISQLMDTFGSNVVTDLSLSDASRLYDITKDINNNKVKSLDLVMPPHDLITTGSAGNQSIDKPKAGLDNYNDIRTYVRSTLKDGYIVKENSPIIVLNGTDQPGLATTEADVLKSYGYNVTKVDNAPTDGYAKTVLVDLTNGADKYTRHYLENRFGVQATTKLPDNTIVPGKAHFIIILGTDAT